MRILPTFSHRDYRSTHKETWMTIHMEELNIKDMSTQHILNSLNLMSRANQEGLLAFSGLRPEYEKRKRNRNVAIQKLR